MAFFRITATQYLTALALVQDYRRHVCFLRPPPRPCYIYISIPGRVAQNTKHKTKQKKNV